MILLTICGSNLIKKPMKSLFQVSLGGICMKNEKSKRTGFQPPTYRVVHNTSCILGENFFTL